MKYTSRINTLEAVPVDLSGQRLYAVAIDGKAHLIDGAVFDLLFKVEHAGAALREKLEAAHPKPERPKPSRRKPPAGKRISEVAQRCLGVLRLHGPLTTAELRDHVYGDLDARKKMQNFSALSLDMRKRGLIERRTNPSTQLDQWHIRAGGGQ